MTILFKKLLFSVLFNTSLFIVLIIGIQNSSNKNKVNLLINETVDLPISFIIGTSFIAGSILGDLILGNLHLREENNL